MALSATITILLGLKVEESTTVVLANIALVLGAVSTVLAAADTFFAHRELWLIRTETVRDLEGLSREIESYYAKLGDDGDPDDAVTSGLQRNLDAAILSDHERWKALRSSGASPSPSTAEANFGSSGK